MYVIGSKPALPPIAAQFVVKTRSVQNDINSMAHPLSTRYPKDLLFQTAGHPPMRLSYYGSRIYCRQGHAAKYNWPFLLCGYGYPTSVHNGLHHRG
jgi:hypothetical protein